MAYGDQLEKQPKAKREGSTQQIKTLLKSEIQVIEQVCPFLQGTVEIEHVHSRATDQDK